MSIDKLLTKQGPHSFEWGPDFSKYENFNTQTNLEKIQAENRQRLENYKQKLIAEGKIKAPIVDEVPKSILDGYEETATQEIEQEKPQITEGTTEATAANTSRSK